MWRSLLFMPVLEERFLARAAERGADAIVLDLEASIAATRKDEARAALAPAVERLRSAGQDVLVRINQPWRPMLKDLEFAVQPGVAAIVIPVCESAEHIRVVDNCIGELETERSISTWQCAGLCRLLRLLAGYGTLTAFFAPAAVRFALDLVSRTT